MSPVIIIIIIVVVTVVIAIWHGLEYIRYMADWIPLMNHLKWEYIWAAWIIIASTLLGFVTQWFWGLIVTQWYLGIACFRNIILLLQQSIPRQIKLFMTSQTWR